MPAGIEKKYHLNVLIRLVSWKHFAATLRLTYITGHYRLPIYPIFIYPILGGGVSNNRERGDLETFPKINDRGGWDNGGREGVKNDAKTLLVQL